MPALPPRRSDVGDVEDAARAGDDRRQPLREDRIGLRGPWRSICAPAVSRSSRPCATASASSRRLDRRGVGGVDPDERARRRRGARSASAPHASMARMVSTSAASRSWRASISARASRSPVRSRKRATAEPPTVRPRTSISRPTCRGDGHAVKGSPRSRRRAIGASSRPADSGCSHVPKARKAARSAGAPAASEQAPATSGGSPGAPQATSRWSSSSTSASARSAVDLEVGDLMAERLVLGLGAIAGADQRDGAQHRESDRADEDGIEHQLDGVDLPREERKAEYRLGGPRRGYHQRTGGRAAGGSETGANRDRSPAMLSHAPSPLSPSAPRARGICRNAAITGSRHQAPRITPM